MTEEVVAGGDRVPDGMRRQQHQQLGRQQQQYEQQHKQQLRGDYAIRLESVKQPGKPWKQPSMLSVTNLI